MIKSGAGKQFRPGRILAQNVEKGNPLREEFSRKAKKEIPSQLQMQKRKDLFSFIGVELQGGTNLKWF